MTFHAVPIDWVFSRIDAFGSSVPSRYGIEAPPNYTRISTLDQKTGQVSLVVPGSAYVVGYREQHDHSDHVVLFGLILILHRPDACQIHHEESLQNVTQHQKFTTTVMSDHVSASQLESSDR